MEKSENSNLKNSRAYVALLSLLLFLCPLLIFGLTRIFYSESLQFDYQDFSLFTAYWLSAGLVWTRMKFMWLLTTCLLGVVILVNIIVLFKNISSDSASINIIQLILSISTFCGVLLMAEFLNSKSFDRRDQFSILGTADRYDVNYPAELINGEGQVFKGSIKSLSFSGAMLELPELPLPFYLKDCCIKIPTLDFFNQQKVGIVELGSNYVRLHFAGLNFLVTFKLYRHLKNNDESKPS